MTMDMLPSDAWSTLLLPGKVFPASSLVEALRSYERLDDGERTRVELLIRHPQVGGPLKQAAIENLLMRFAVTVDECCVTSVKAEPTAALAPSRPASRKRRRSRDRLDPFRKLLATTENI